MAVLGTKLGGIVYTADEAVSCARVLKSFDDPLLVLLSPCLEKRACPRLAPLSDACAPETCAVGCRSDTTSTSLGSAQTQTNPTPPRPLLCAAVAPRPQPRDPLRRHHLLPPPRARTHTLLAPARAAPLGGDGAAVEPRARRRPTARPAVAVPRPPLA
eukprot:2190424-Prymnesium_polylepis.1